MCKVITVFISLSFKLNFGVFLWISFHTHFYRSRGLGQGVFPRNTIGRGSVLLGLGGVSGSISMNDLFGDTFFQQSDWSRGKFI